jgi:hypothetical protein
LSVAFFPPRFLGTFPVASIIPSPGHFFFLGDLGFPEPADPPPPFAFLVFGSDGSLPWENSSPCWY